jgi:5-methylcytosine-specific restriction endonuclease McrA
MSNRDNGPDANPSGRARQKLLAEVAPEGSTCHLCGAPIEYDRPRFHPRGPSMDHVIPRSKGGTWERANLRPAHYGCNSSRGNKDLNPKPVRRSRAW